MPTKSVLRVMVVVAFGMTCAASLRAHPSWGIVVSSSGIIYFSDLETVWKVDRSGNLSVFRAGVGGHHVHELTIDRQDNVYGPDYSYVPATGKYMNGVWKMTPAGAQSYLYLPSSETSGISIWRDGAGNMYSIEQNNHTKEKTLLLRRTPEGRISTLAGGAYGHADGKGVAARFGSVNAMTFGSDGNIYLTDGTYVRRVTLAGEVTTVARDLTARSSEDKPTLFGSSDNILAGLAVDFGGSVYVADAGNRRLLKISNDGQVGVVYRCDPPFFPNGVFAAGSGDVYVLEFGFVPPGTTDNPRVRKISADGQNKIIASSGLIRTGVRLAQPGEVVRSRLKSVIRFVNTRVAYFVLVVLAGLVTVTVLVWRTGRKQRI